MKDASYLEFLFMNSRKHITFPLQKPACDHNSLTLFKETIFVFLRITRNKEIYCLAKRYIRWYIYIYTPLYFES